MSVGIQSFWQKSGAAPLATVSHAKGLHVWDSTGKRYIDVTSGPVAVNIGHGNERVLRAMREQAERVCFAYPSAFESESNLRLTQRLAQEAGLGLDRAFFVSSGSEAVEKCLQFARRVALAHGEPRRTKVISRNPSYHGSTRATAALSADPGYAPLLTEKDAPILVSAPFSYRTPTGRDREQHAAICAEELRERIQSEGPETVLAFILEPVMGFCGGADYAPEPYYQRIREICTEFGVLLIFDETISGAGRTGRFLAAHWWRNAAPDLVTLAKGIGGGYFPLSAFLASHSMVEEVTEAGGFHIGHTHKAQPLACAVGLAVLDVTRDDRLIANAEAMGKILRARLDELKAELPIVGNVRGLGLLNAVEFVRDPVTKAMLPRELDVLGRVQAIARARGLLIYGRRTHGGQFGDWIMVSPPLIATSADIEEISDGLAATFRDYAEELHRGGHLR